MNNIKEIIKPKAAVVLILLVVTSLHFFFGFQRIREFSGGDETLWSYERVPDFWSAVSSHKWKKTNVSDKPGITVVLISGMGLPFISDPRTLGEFMYNSKSLSQLKSIEDVYFYLRLPILLFSLFSVVVYFFLIKKLLGKKIALISTVLIGLSPILIGMSIYVNSDSLLWIFVPLTILSFLVYKKQANRKYLIVSGVFLGLSLLTKFVAVILFPYLFLLLLFQRIFEQQDSKSYFKRSLIDYLILILVSMAVIVLLFPATWVKPRMILEATVLSQPFLKLLPILIVIAFSYIVDKIFFKEYLFIKIWNYILKYKMIFIKIVCFSALCLIIFTFINVYSGMKVIDFISTLGDPRINNMSQGDILQKIPSNIFSSFYSLVFGLTPIAVIAFIFTIFHIIRIKKYSENDEKYNNVLIAFYLIFFILVYYIASSFMGVSLMVRYQIALYPIASIVAAIGLYYIIDIKKIRHYFIGSRFYFLIFTLIILSSYSLHLITPYYLEYSSSLLPKKYALNLDNSSEGSWEITQYLNKLPNANNLYIWTDVRQVCEKFVGRCASGLKTWSMKDDHFDYFVVPLAEKNNNIRFMDDSKKIKIGSTLINADELYSINKNYVYKFTIDDREATTINVIKNNQ